MSNSVAKYLDLVLNCHVEDVLFLIRGCNEHT